MRELTAKLSIEQKLPLLICGVLLVVIGSGVLAAYREVRQSAIAAAGERLQGVTLQLGGLLESAARRRATETSQLAGEPVIRAFLRSPRPATRSHALVALQKFLSQSELVAAVELWDASGTVVLVAGAALPRSDAGHVRELMQSVSGGESAAVRPIRTFGDSLRYPIIAAVLDRGTVLGYLVHRRRLAASPQAGRQLAELIGPDAGLYLGNADGALWTDFASVVVPPPLEAETP